jgi:hypothetical protein
MTEEWSSSNQRKAEPMPPTPAHGDPAASRVPGVQGESPDDFAADDAAGATEVASATSGGSSEASGDAHEVPVPSEQAAEGTSEELDPVEGVRVTAIAPEGHADGETDNRMPPTTTF